MEHESKNEAFSTIAQALAWAKQVLLSDDSLSDKNTANLETHLLLQQVTHLNRIQMILQEKTILDEASKKHFMESVLERKKGRPIAYILGYKEFWSMPFKVNEHTLIPRSDTETLVQLAINYVKSNDNVKTILDLGTGSGIVAICLAKKFPSINVIATDLSKEALKVAKENAQLHQCENIQWLESNWFSALKTIASPTQKFSLIVSNPPYIESNDVHLSQGDLRFEPKSALISGQDGLDDIRQIIIKAKDFLASGGFLMLEHGYDQAKLVQNIFQEHGYQDISTHKDLGFQDRVTMAQYLI